MTLEARIRAQDSLLAVGCSSFRAIEPCSELAENAVGKLVSTLSPSRPFPQKALLWKSDSIYKWFVNFFLQSSAACTETEGDPKTRTVCSQMD